MFRRNRRGLVLALILAALALPAAPAVAAGRGEPGAPATFGMEMWKQLVQVGDWLRTVFLSDHTSFIDPDGRQGSTPNGTSFIDPNGAQSPDHTSYIDPNG